MRKKQILAAIVVFCFFPALSYCGWTEGVLVDSTIEVPWPTVEVRNDSIFVVYDNEFIRSIDGGATWRDNYQFSDGYYWISGGFDLGGDTLTVFFGIHYPISAMWFYFSEDFGITWQGPRDAWGFSTFADPSCTRIGSTIYQCAISPYNDSGMVDFTRSTDFGVNWSFPELIHVYSDPGYPRIYRYFGRIFIISEIGDGHGLNRSTIHALWSADDGGSWHRLDSLTPEGYNQLVEMDASFNGKMAFVYNDWDSFMSNESTVYICVSADSGSSWTWPVPLSDTVYNQRPRISTTGDTIAVCWSANDGFAVRRSNDFGNSWSEMEIVDAPATIGDIDWDHDVLHCVYIGFYNGNRALFYSRWEPESGIDEDEPLPQDYSLLQNYPNPFNSSTMIEYGLPVETRVKIEIYDILGRLCKTLIDTELPAGYHQALWNGEDESNQPVVSSVYLVKMTSGDRQFTNRAVLVK